MDKTKSVQPSDVQILNKTLSHPPRQKFKSVIIIIALLILVVSIFLYAKALKNRKSWPDLIQDAKKAVVVIKTPNFKGSGFLISPDGLIITNSHVIQNNSNVEVIFNSGESKKASIIKIGIDPLDIAILKVAGDNFVFLTLADSNSCKAGEEVVAIGAPLSLRETVTKGIISNCNRQLKAKLSDIKYIQTDTAVNSGNSGGPLINSKGEVLGILTWKIAEEGVEGLNFAIAINVVKDFKDGKLLKLEEVVRQMEEERLQKEQQKKQIIPLKPEKDIVKAVRNIVESKGHKLISIIVSIGGDPRINIELVTGEMMAPRFFFPPPSLEFEQDIVKAVRKIVESKGHKLVSIVVSIRGDPVLNFDLITGMMMAPSDEQLEQMNR